VLVTACPLCKKTFNSGSKIEVKDIAELVAESMTLPGYQVKIKAFVDQ
jgi:Fe-S oxidoreductase